MSDDSTRHSRTVSRRNFIGAAAGAGVIAIAGCTKNEDGGGSGGDSTTTAGSNGGTLSGDISITGSSTVFPLATQMKTEFQKEHPDVKISIQSTGSGGGFQNHFCPGDSDINNASRPIKDEEKTLCSDNGVEPVELKVATDALTVVVNTENDWFDDGCLTIDQLRQIWSPDTAPSKWSDVDPSWPDEEIQLFGPTDASGTFDYFTEEIIGEGGKSRTDYKATEQDNVIIQGVSNDKYAMGYLGFAYYTENSGKVQAVSVDDGDGCVAPSLETAKSGEYTPLARPLFTYPSKEALQKDHVAAFVEFWIENSTNREIVADKVGYVPNSEDEKSEMMGRLESAIGN